MGGYGGFKEFLPSVTGKVPAKDASWELSDFGLCKNLQQQPEPGSVRLSAILNFFLRKKNNELSKT
jgi:hypothetical protein